MHEIYNNLKQLPNAIYWEVVKHAGATAELAPAHLAAHYRAVAQNLIAHYRSRYVPLQPSVTIVEELIVYQLDGPDLSFVNGPRYSDHARWVTYEIVRYLELFVRDLAPVQTRLEQEAARQLAQRQAEEAARQLAQRQAEEAARAQAQRQAQEAAQRLAQQQSEEAARQLAQRQADEAARRLVQQQAAEQARVAAEAEAAARQLAQQQSEAAAQAFAQRMAEEEALREARLALELAAAPASAAVPIEDAINQGGSLVLREATEIRFIPGPAATAEIELATLKLKHSVDAAVSQFASDIGPYLKPAQAGAGMGMTHSA